MILPDRSVNVRGPLIEVIEWPRRINGIAEEIVRIQVTPVPHPNRVAVKLVIPGLSDISYLCSGILSVLSRISIRNNVGFRNVVEAQQQVGRAAVVQAEERIVEVLAVHRKQVRGARHPVGGEIPITRLRVHHHSGRGLGNIS